MQDMSRTPQEERNLKLVMDMFDHVLIPFDADAAGRYIAVDYIQHNQLVDTGIEPLKAFLRKVRIESPDATHDIKRTFVEGDHVIVHYHVCRWPGDAGFAVMDIFRIEGDKIVEHWDVMQDVPADSPKPHSPF